MNNRRCIWLSQLFRWNDHIRTEAFYHYICRIQKPGVTSDIVKSLVKREEKKREPDDVHSKKSIVYTSEFIVAIFCIIFETKSLFAKFLNPNMKICIFDSILT